LEIEYDDRSQSRENGNTDHPARGYAVTAADGQGGQERAAYEGEAREANKRTCQACRRGQARCTRGKMALAGPPAERHFKIAKN
jgi:hypothetical protein